MEILQRFSGPAENGNDAHHLGPSDGLAQFSLGFGSQASVGTPAYFSHLGYKLRENRGIGCL